ncbi:MAG: hypothetical protein LBQ65_04515, partial [Tannerellaceae bacterium]|nr:hypothetical protein [Tannerellaceae bacterium]
NEKPEWGLASLTVGQTYSSNDLESKILNFPTGNYITVDANNPIPMYRQYKNLQVSLEGALSIGGQAVTLGEVERLYAKVTLVIGTVFANLANGGDPIQLDSLGVKSMAKYSLLTPTLQYPVTTASGVFSPPSTTHTSNYVANATRFKDSVVYYLPEHRLSVPDYKTYLSLKVSLLGNTAADQQREYKLVIGDGIETCSNDSMLNGQLPLQNLFITRNTHYQYTANIKSFDIRSEEDIEIRPRIVAWETTSMDSTIFDDYVFTVSQDLFQRAATGTAFNGVIEVTTDHPNGWSAVVAPTGTRPTSLTGGPYTNKPSGKLTFTYSGATIASPAADTIKVTVGKVTKKIIIKN